MEDGTYDLVLWFQQSNSNISVNCFQQNSNIDCSRIRVKAQYSASAQNTDYRTIILCFLFNQFHSVHEHIIEVKQNIFTRCPRRPTLPKWIWLKCCKWVTGQLNLGDCPTGPHANVHVLELDTSFRELFLLFSILITCSSCHFVNLLVTGFD